MEEDFELEKYTIEWGEKADPIIVLTGSVQDYEEFCMLTHRNKDTAVAVKQGFQIPLYPDVEIVHYKNFWLNGAYNSLEYKDRITKQRIKELDKLSNG